MGKAWLLVAACVCVAVGASQIAAQDSAVGHKCECGAHPPGPPRDRQVTPYAGEPPDMSPYAKFAAPYDLTSTHPNIYSGAGRDLPEPKGLTEVRIGFLGPIGQNPDQVFGFRMLRGAQLAVDEANANGGYGGKPFRLMPHNDYDNWQAKAAYGNNRPTNADIWGSSANEVVKMVYDENVWAVFGSISSESTHIALRVALRAEVPIVNSASTDPTIPETYIPWYFTDLQDDRVQCLTLARRIFTELGLKRVAILRVNNRYGRFGVIKLRDASRRLGHPIVIEQKYMPGDTDFWHQLQVIRSSRADAIVLWADQDDAAQILVQMQAHNMKLPVFGAYRTLGPQLLTQAGSAAEGFEAVFPYDPTRTDARWLDFNRRYQARYNEQPEQFAALAYDAMNALLDSICKAGLNRARIHDALANIEHYDGVTGPMTFDPNQKNVAPMYLGTVHNGAITYRLATMEKSSPAATIPPVSAGEPSASLAPQSSQIPDRSEPTAAPPQVADAIDEAPSKLAPPQVAYARVGEDGTSYSGPQPADLPAGPVRVVVFGPHATQVTASPEVISALAAPGLSARAWQLVPIASDQNWGAASTQLVHALIDDRALVIVALDRNSAHLAEQMSLKAFVPVLAISDDKALTSTNIPWIFRLPSQTTPAVALEFLRAAVARSGANAERLRDVLASGIPLDGLAFLPTGEPKGR